VPGVIVRLIVVFTVGLAAVVGLILFLSDESHDKAVETVAALQWVGEPRSYASDRLPRDRVAIGRIRNAGSERIEASADDFEVRDASGRELFARVQFIDALAAPPKEPEKQLQIGTELELGPGRTAPLTVRYRLERRARPPVSVHFKEVPALELPGEDTPGG
jgi:hypothetical protein